MNKKEQLQKINRTARALTELICGKPEYENLYNDLRIMIDSNEEQIFEMMKSTEKQCQN